MIESEIESHSVFRFLRHIDRADIAVGAEYSTDLAEWFPLPDESDPDAHFDGRLEPRRALRPISLTEPQIFIRLRVEEMW